jgi:hypothetical protein
MREVNFYGSTAFVMCHGSKSLPGSSSGMFRRRTQRDSIHECSSAARKFGNRRDGLARPIVAPGRYGHALERAGFRGDDRHIARGIFANSESGAVAAKLPALLRKCRA